MKKGKLFIVSAPSGAGKTTLIREVLKEFKTIAYSISHTTRAPRKNEIHGKDYFFVHVDEFEQMITQDKWLEWARVHDNYYGTSWEFVKDRLAEGISLLLDIDVQGAFQIMGKKMPFVSIFIEPPSMEELARRLEKRGTDAPDVIAKRLANAAKEMEKKSVYQYVVVNDELEQAVLEICRIFQEEISAENKSEC